VDLADDRGGCRPRGREREIGPGDPLPPFTEVADGGGNFAGL